MKTICKITFLFLIPILIYSQDKIATEVIADGFAFPVDIAFDHNNNMFVVEKRGTIKVALEDGTSVSAPFLDIRDRVNSSASERGLLGLAFDPNYDTNGYIYVHYTGINFSRISRFTASTTTVADPDSELEILYIPQPYSNHNGGSLHFGPNGYLYIGMGDGGKAGDPENRSQNRQELLGKMLRIDVSGNLPYSIPIDNPFANDDQTLDEIWAFGLRNPWKFSFDMQTGDMYIADVGQNSWEEVDFQQANSSGGENYGWRCYEGFANYNNIGCDPEDDFTTPIFVYETDDNKDGCSITGGYVYRGDDIPYLDGRYVYGDFCTGKIWALSENQCGVWTNEFLIEISSQDLSTFGQDNNGEIYFAEVGTGKINKVSALCKLTSSIEVITPTCGANNGSIVVAASSSTATFAITGDKYDSLGEGVYELVVSEGNCVNRYCIDMQSLGGEFDHPEIEDPDPLTICEGNPFSFTFDPPILQDFPKLTMDLYLDSTLLVSNWDGSYLFDKGGIYQLLFINEDGCTTDFIPLFDVTIAPVPQIFIEKVDETLVATPGFITYLWYKGTTPIPGENKNVLSNIEPGVTYAVVGYTLAGCLSFSEMFLVNSTFDVSWIDQYSISPNPTNQEVRVDLVYKTPIESTIKVFKPDGLEIYSRQHDKTQHLVDVIDLSTNARGIYFLQITANNQSFLYKIVKQ